MVLGSAWRAATVCNVYPYCFTPSSRLFPALLSIQVVQWMAGYQETLGEFGVEEEDVAFPSGPHSGLSLLADKYVGRVEATLSSWLTNIVEVGSWGWGVRRGRVSHWFFGGGEGGGEGAFCSFHYILAGSV